MSFSDGRALCLLLHHYHKELLPLEYILWETTQTLSTKGVDLDVSMDDSFSTFQSSEPLSKEEYQDCLMKEKLNFTTFLDKVIIL